MKMKEIGPRAGIPGAPFPGSANGYEDSSSLNVNIEVREDDQCPLVHR